MSNLPKIGDTIKTGTLEEIKAIEGVYTRGLGSIKNNRHSAWMGIDEIDFLGTELTVCKKPDSLYIYLKSDCGSPVEYPIWAYEALLSKPTKQPKKSPLETEHDQLEARLALVKEGVRLESEIKTDASDLKAKRARLAEIKKNGGNK